MVRRLRGEGLKFNQTTCEDAHKLLQEARHAKRVEENVPEVDGDTKRNGYAAEHCQESRHLGAPVGEERHDDVGEPEHGVGDVYQEWQRGHHE